MQRLNPLPVQHQPGRRRDRRRREDMSVASARTVPGLPSGNSTTNSSTPFHRLNPEHANSSPNNGCIGAVTRTSHGNTARRCCSLSPSLPAPGKATCCSPSAQLPSTPVTGSATTPPPTPRQPLPRSGRQQRRQDHRRVAALRPDHRRRAGVRPAGRHRRPTALPLRRCRLRTPIPRHQIPLAVRILGSLPPRTPTAVSMLDRLLHHCHVVITVT